MTVHPSTIQVPGVPEPPKRSPIPIFATVAPVIAALAIWAFTHSPFALVFAIIGPVVALASVGDSRRRARADTRRERARFEQEIVAAIHAVDEAHAREREQRERDAPSVAVLASSPVRDSERWRGTVAGELTVRLGTGRVDSATQLQGDSAGPDDGAAAETLRALFDRAKELNGAPVTADASLGIGVCGSHPQSLAATNALILQLAHALSPVAVTVATNADAGGGLEWVSELPHSSMGAPESTEDRASKSSPDCLRVEFRSRDGSGSVVVAAAASEHSLPLECRVVVRVTGSIAHLARHPGGVSQGDYSPEFVSDRQAIAFAKVLRSAAGALPGRPGHSLATKIALSSLCQPDATGRSNLAACIGVDTHGQVIIDLVRDGPHAIVGGTTGSGKSELLITWILAMAAHHGPAEVNFLLVDFKGGAAFSTVEGLPHTVGMLTDLDESAAHRAIISLRAELIRRERILAAAGARSIDDLGSGTVLARLVIVVDEFATLTAQLPELHELFADLAARGRSLGIHLILCTQRPAATVRDAVLANCPLRVSLRVTNQADSVAVIGRPDAAQLPRHQAGRALIARGDGEPTLVQLAIASTNDIGGIENRTGVPDELPHRPWLDPLPDILLPSDIPEADYLDAGASEVRAPALVFGLTDIPDEQRRAVAVYDPEAQGNLMVLGGHRSGKTTALAVLAHRSAAKLVVPKTVEGAWDTVADALRAIRDGVGPTLVVLDDVDELMGRIPPDHESEFTDRLVRLAREGPRAGLTLVLSAGSIRGRLQSVATLCESTLLLRMPSKQDHVFVGGAPGDYVSELSPGGGTWRGRRIQVVLDETPLVATAHHTEEFTISRGNPLAVISSRPASIRGRLEKFGPVTMIGPTLRQGQELSIAEESIILLGDPDAWQGAWGVLAALRGSARLAFHDCPVSEFRALTRGRELPPPVDSADTLVVLEPDGQMFRAALAL